MAVDVLIRRSSLRGSLYDPRDLLGTRDEHEVTASQLCGLGPHTVRHESLEVGVDRSILCRNDVPGRNRLPRRRRGQRLTKRAAGDRLLRGRECARLLRRQAIGEHLGILRRVDVEEPGGVGDEGLPKP